MEEGQGQERGGGLAIRRRHLLRLTPSPPSLLLHPPPSLHLLSSFLISPPPISAFSPSVFFFPSMRSPLPPLPLLLPHPRPSMICQGGTGGSPLLRHLMASCPKTQRGRERLWPVSEPRRSRLLPRHGRKEEEREEVEEEEEASDCSL